MRKRVGMINAFEQRQIIIMIPYPIHLLYGKCLPDHIDTASLRAPSRSHIDMCHIVKSRDLIAIAGINLRRDFCGSFYIRSGYGQSVHISVPEFIERIDMCLKIVFLLEGINGVICLDDCAKAVAFGSLYDGDVWDFFSGKAKPQAALPIAVVLTIPAAGSEGSSSCVISNDELGAKNGTNGDCFRPKLAYLDPQVTFTLPPFQTAAGITDMIAHICERFFSGAEDVPVTDNIGCGLVRALIDAAPKALANPEDYEARANIMWAGTLAHNDIAGCGRSLGAGRAGGWESHALEHALSAYDTSITHGAGLAVIMPAWMRHVWREDPARFELFGREVFGLDGERDEVAVQAIECLAEFFASLDMPTCLDDFGLQPDCIDELVESVVSVKGEPFGCFKKLTRDDVAAIYASAFKS